MTAPAIRELEAGLLEIREGGGWASLLGLPFFLGGVFLLLVAVGVIPVENADELASWTAWLLGFMGLAFVAVGGRLALERTWTRLDLSRGRVVRLRGLLVPMTREEHRVEEYDAVLLSLEKGDSESADSYPLSLRARGNRPPLILCTGTDFGVARERAGVVASALGLPLVDTTTGHPSVTAATLASATLQERVRQGAERPGGHPRPPALRSVVREDGGGAEIVLPAAPFRAVRLLGPAVVAGFLAWVGPGTLDFFRRSGTPVGVQIAVGGFVGLFFLGLPLLGTLNALLRSARGRTTVHVDEHGIRIEEVGAWTARHTRIAAEDILGLGCGTSEAAGESARRETATKMARAGRRVPQPAPGGQGPGVAGWVSRLPPSDGVIIKCRAGLTPLGAGLPDDEVRYLHGVIARALARDSAGP